MRIFLGICGLSLKPPARFVLFLMDKHWQCLLVDYDFLGKTRSCTAKYLDRLLSFISDSQLHLPLDVLAMSEMPEAIIAQEFNSLPNQGDPQVYHSFQLYVKELCRIADFFRIIEKNIRLCITRHETPPSDGTILMIVLNLQRVWKYTLELKANTECTLFQTLDLHPAGTAEILRSIMTPVRILHMNLES